MATTPNPASPAPAEVQPRPRSDLGQILVLHSFEELNRTAKRGRAGEILRLNRRADESNRTRGVMTVGCIAVMIQMMDGRTDKGQIRICQRRFLAEGANDPRFSTTCRHDHIAYEMASWRSVTATEDEELELALALSASLAVNGGNGPSTSSQIRSAPGQPVRPPAGLPSIRGPNGVAAPAPQRPPVTNSGHAAPTPLQRPPISYAAPPPPTQRHPAYPPSTSQPQQQQRPQMAAAASSGDPSLCPGCSGSISW